MSSARAAVRTATSSSPSARSAVAVLEVDPEVLDRLATQLLAHPADEQLVAVEELEQHGLVVVDALQRGSAVLLDQPGVEAVGRHVDGVHRLPPRTLTRELAGQRRVRRVEPGVEVLP